VGTFSIRYFYPGSYIRSKYLLAGQKKALCTKTKGLKEIDFSFY